MKCNGLRSALALALVVGASASADAQSVRYGGMKDFGGVPVPAPAPIPLYHPAWYFRFDAGIGLADDNDASIAGSPFIGNPGLPAFLNDDFETFATFGAGVGYYWGPRLRSDLTVETRTNGSATIDASPPGLDSVHDRTTLHGGFTLFNLYYDFAKHGGFTPYIGAGIGFSFSKLSRSNTTDFGVGSVTIREEGNDIALAAAFTAGFSYALSEMTVLDFNYRFLHLGSNDIDLTTVDGQRSVVTIGETNEHQLRAGVRFNVF